MHAKHWVWREKHRHGKVVRVRVRVSYVKTEHRKVCTTTSPATAPTTTPTPTPAPVVTLAALDPSFTQDPMNPLAVTYHYSASATTNTGGVSVPDPALPAGILNLYNDGLLACSINVGGSVTGGNCPITTTIGAHTVVTTYISGTTSATTTDTEQINPFTTTTAVTATPDVARPCTSTTSGQYTIDQCQYLLTATTIDQNGRPLAAWETVTFTATDSTGIVYTCGFSLAPGAQQTIVAETTLWSSSFLDSSTGENLVCSTYGEYIASWTVTATYAGTPAYLPSTSSQPVTVQPMG